MVKEASHKWHDLGLELLEQEDEESLHHIRSNSKPYDVTECCKEMFQLWLRKCKIATWNRLVHALNEVGLIQLATKIEGMLSDGHDTGTYIYISMLI